MSRKSEELEKRIPAKTESKVEVNVWKIKIIILLYTIVVVKRYFSAIWAAVQHQEMKGNGHQAGQIQSPRSRNNWVQWVSQYWYPNTNQKPSI